MSCFQGDRRSFLSGFGDEVRIGEGLKEGPVGRGACTSVLHSPKCQGAMLVDQGLQEDVVPVDSQDARSDCYEKSSCRTPPH